MTTNFLRLKFLFVIIFISLFAFASAQENSSDSSSNSTKEIEVSDTYNFKYENALKNIFKEHEGIEDIYTLEPNCPKFNLNIDITNAEKQFIKEVGLWIKEVKTKYPKAYKFISKELSNIN